MKMSNKQDVINLLPWYNVGKLSNEEKAMVDHALTTDPSLKAEFLMDQSMASLIKEDKSLLDHSLFDDTTSRIDNLFAQIDLLDDDRSALQSHHKEHEKPARANVFFQLKQKFDELLTSSSQHFTYTVFAALTIVQLGLLVFFIVPSVNMDAESEYYTASADTPIVEDTTEEGTVLIINMEGNIQLDNIKSLPSNVTINLLPSETGYYRARINKHLSEIEIQELKNELSNKHGNVQFIGEESPH